MHISKFNDKKFVCHKCNVIIEEKNCIEVKRWY